METVVRKTFFLSLLLFSFSSLYSQELTKKELIKAVQEADISYYYDEDYEKAAGLYESLLNIYPDNSNLSAKLGICYLNIDGKNTEALRLLKKASKSIVSSEKDYIEYGEKALWIPTFIWQSHIIKMTVSRKLYHYIMMPKEDWGEPKSSGRITLTSR
jgi:tetratricopeptide (TPR) repeat protein